MLRPPTYTTLPERIVHYGTLVFTGLVLAFLIAPVLAIVPLSFNAEPYFSYPMPGLSLQWYGDFFGNARWRDALILSLELAACVTVLATALGTVAALGLSRTSLPWRGVILGMLILPMIVPVIITAVSVFMFYGYFGLIGTFPGSWTRTAGMACTAAKPVPARRRGHHLPRRCCDARRPGPFTTFL